MERAAIIVNYETNEVLFEVNSNEQIDEISKILKEDGKTLVNICLKTDDKSLTFRLKNMRNLDRKSLNLLRKREISAIIS